jgi:hypothetical protein
VPRPCQNEDGIGLSGWIVRDIHTAGTQPILELKPEGSNTTGSIHARNDANAGHGGIILTYVIARASILSAMQSKDSPKQSTLGSATARNEAVSAKQGIASSQRTLLAMTCWRILWLNCAGGLYGES